MLKAYTAIARYGVSETLTLAGHRLGAIYDHFAEAIKHSERPPGLDELELEQYDLLLGEQAFEFEEKAIELYAANSARVEAGIYDQWVRRSYVRLAEIYPARYARQERREPYVQTVP